MQASFFCPCFSAGVVVTQLSAADADSGSNGWLMYRLESGAQDRFVVEPLSGAVLVGNTTLDREERGSYRLVVIASDRGTPPMSGTATLTVILDDVNDSRPRFIEPVTMINVNESTPPGVVVATLTAEDPDLHPRLEYYIISVEAKDDGNNPVDGLQESFGIDLHTGETLLTSDRWLITYPRYKSSNILKTTCLSVNFQAPFLYETQSTESR